MAIFQAGCKSSGGGAGEEHQAFFYGQGSVGNKWLALGASSKQSDEIPYIVIDDCEISALSWTNSLTSLDIDIEVYKNGSLVATYPILNKQTMAKSNITAIPCVHGDKLGVYIKRNGGSNATDPVVTLYLNVLVDTDSEVSS